METESVCSVDKFSEILIMYSVDNKMEWITKHQGLFF